MVRFGKQEIQTPAICGSIIGKNLPSMEKKLEKAVSKGADLVELRLDKLKSNSDWKDLLKVDIPTIVTNRSKKEGGQFVGGEQERIDILLDAINSGASCIDIELSTARKKRETVLEAAEGKGVGTIVSYHNFETIPETKKLEDKVKQIEALNCDFAKIIGFSNNEDESLRILKFLIRSSENVNTPIITFAMGEKGKFTRVTAPLLGSPITYASIEEKTAPGQLNISSVKEVLDKFRN